MRRDQYYYDRVQVEALLPGVIDTEFGILASRAEQERSAKADPSHGNTLVAMLADVRRAWDRALERFDQDMLIARHVNLVSFDAIAELAGLEGASEAAEIEECAMSALLEYLNGGGR